MFWVILAGRFSFEAGSMRVIFKGGETVYVLGGWVRVKTEDYDIKGTSGVYYENAGVVHLKDADITSANLKMRAKQLRYLRKREELHLRGEAYFEDRYRVVEGERITARGDSAWVWGGVVVKAKKRGVVVMGDSAFYDGGSSYGYVWENAHALILRRDTVEVWADRFFLHRDTVYGIGNTKTISRRFKAKGDTFRMLVEDTLLKKVVLLGNPEVEWKNGRGTAKTVEITFQNGYVRDINFVDSAEVFYTDGNSRINVRGGYIRAYAEGDSLKHVHVERLYGGEYE